MQAKTYHPSDHEISFHLIDPDAITVIERLRQAGHEAYLVGGGVRDLLAKKTPKDFDISTSALPEEIKTVFGRQCLLIGRRFRLAHIRFGRKIIEVATFRAGENSDELITRDNVWGSAEEDVMRRDFTINGLFYDPSNHTVIDYVGGWGDIQKGILRSIGDPNVRFKQDPVRMIRLLKFRARFGYDIAEACKNALLRCKSELTKSSPARILEELLRMLESGYCARFIYLMSDSGIFKLLFPELDHYLRGKHGDAIFQYLESADILNRKSLDRSLNRSVLVSCLLFPILEEQIQSHYIQEQKRPTLGDIIIMTSSIIKQFVTTSFSHFPRRMSATVSYILSTQYRLTPISGKRHLRHKSLYNHDFPFALQFLKLRSLIDPELAEDYNNWKRAFRQTQQARGGHTPHPPPKKSTRGRKRHDHRKPKH